MNCANYKEQFTLLLTDSLDEAQIRELENHLSGCPSCQMELKISQRIWELMGEAPKPLPSDSLRSGFNAILKNYKDEMIVNRRPGFNLLKRVQDLWHLQPRLQMGYVCLLLIVGLALGFALNRPGQSEISYHQQINSLSAQVLEMKQMMMLSLLENPSASQRIRAVGYTDEISKVNRKVIDALLTTLNEDPNINVRLITLEALVKFAKEPRVREGLVQSIAQQDSPLLQSAMADVMVKLQEKGSVNSLRKLLHKKDLNSMVKIKIEQSIQKLI